MTHAPLAPLARPLRMLVALLLLSSSAALAQDDAGALLRLAERLVGTWGAPGEMRVEIVPLALPTGAGVEGLHVPLPSDFEVVGSLTRYERDAWVSLQVVLDGPRRTTDAFDALRSAFEEEDWTFLAEGGMSGFVPTAPALYARACAPMPDEGDRPVAFVNVNPLDDGASDVRIDLTRDAWEGVCVAHEHGPPEGFAPLPTLAAPAGGSVSGQLLSHGPEDAMTLAVLRGSGDVDAIVAHYSAELEAANWTVAPGTVRHDLGVRSRWSYVDAAGIPWAGVLAIEWPVRTGPVMLSFTVVAEPGP